MLQSLSIELAHEVDVEALYEKILDVAKTIIRSDFASMQQYFPHLGARGELKLLGICGFSEDAAKFWAWVRADSSCTCGRALVRRQRVVAADVETPFSRGNRRPGELSGTGIRAVQSTPLLSRRGELVGMISTHWKDVRQPPSAICGCSTSWRDWQPTSSSAKPRMKNCVGAKNGCAR